MPSIAMLAAQTHEAITISFGTQYRPPSPGSSAWSIIAKNIRVGLLVPADRPLPNWVLARMLASTGDPNQLIDQYIVLQGVGDRLFGGGGDPSFPIPLTIEASSEVPSPDVLEFGVT